MPVDQPLLVEVSHHVAEKASINNNTSEEGPFTVQEEKCSDRVEILEEHKSASSEEEEEKEKEEPVPTAEEIKAFEEDEDDSLERCGRTVKIYICRISR